MGYLYTKNGKCFVGIESIPDRFNQIRLGRVFLRNFYTSLDFENDLIILGLNLGGAASGWASIKSQANSTAKVAAEGGAAAFFILMLLGAGGVAFYYLVKKR